MTLAWIGLALMIGTCLGFILASLMAAAKRGDEVSCHHPAGRITTAPPLPEHTPSPMKLLAKRTNHPETDSVGAPMRPKPDLAVAFEVKGPPDVLQENHP